MLSDSDDLYHLPAAAFAVIAICDQCDHLVLPAADSNGDRMIAEYSCLRTKYHVMRMQCCIKRVRGVLQHPGPQFLGACNWWEWKIFTCCYRSVRGPHLAQLPGPH